MWSKRFESCRSFLSGVSPVIPSGLSCRQVAAMAESKTVAKGLGAAVSLPLHHTVLRHRCSLLLLDSRLPRTLGKHLLCPWRCPQVFTSLGTGCCSSCSQLCLRCLDNVRTWRVSQALQLGWVVGPPLGMLEARGLTPSTAEPDRPPSPAKPRRG